jgi:hypothetical protein
LLVVAAIFGLATLGAACGDNRDDTVPDPERVEVALLDPAAPADRDLDLLFVVQDSCCMLDKQGALRASLPLLVEELLRMSGGPPNLHVGVVSTDLGTTSEYDADPGPSIGNGPGSCAGTGRGAALQNGTHVLGPFLRDVTVGDERVTNYTGTLTEAIQSMVRLGPSGCAFEQPLRAARLALRDDINPGFAREDAALAVVILAEDEDCSATSTDLFTTDPATELGRLASFRCTQFGVTCEVGGRTPSEMGELGNKRECRASESSRYLLPVADYPSMLGRDPRRILMATIVGDAEPVLVIELTPPGGGTPAPTVAHTCVYNGPNNSREAADPAVRITDAARRFRRNVVASSCANEYHAPMATIGRQIRSLLGDRCLVGDVAQLPADCIVADEHTDGTRTPIPRCDTMITRDCFTLVHDPSCTTAHQLRLDVRRTHPADRGTLTSVRCVP